MHKYLAIAADLILMVLIRLLLSVHYHLSWIPWWSIIRIVRRKTLTRTWNVAVIPTSAPTATVIVTGSNITALILRFLMLPCFLLLSCRPYLSNALSVEPINGVAVPAFNCAFTSRSTSSSTNSHCRIWSSVSIVSHGLIFMFYTFLLFPLIRHLHYT